MDATRTPPRHGYWSERFERAQSDPNEARALLVEFSTLASDGRDADVLLVQWVAAAVRRWAEDEFQASSAGKAFRVAYPRGRRSNKEAAKPGLLAHHEKKVAGIALILRLSRVKGHSLNRAAAIAARALAFKSKGPTAAELLQAYEDRGRLSPSDWFPMFATMDEVSRTTVAKAATPGPKPKKQPD